MSGFAPEVRAKLARIIRVGLDRHRREVNEHGYCATCGDPAPEQDEARGDESAGSEFAPSQPYEESENFRPSS